MDWVAWQGSKVVIAYDANAVTKDSVRIARSENATHLRGRGALVGSLSGIFPKARSSMIVGRKAGKAPTKDSILCDEALALKEQALVNEPVRYARPLVGGRIFGHARARPLFLL